MWSKRRDAEWQALTLSKDGEENIVESIVGEAPEIGGRCFGLLSGGGHLPEQIMLHCQADGLLLAADNV